MTAVIKAEDKYCNGDYQRAVGEMVGRDIHGLTIWGRCCTGQAILLDKVICDIYDEAHRE